MPSRKTPPQRRQNHQQHHQPLSQHCLNTLNLRSIHTREESITDTRVPDQGTSPNSLPTAMPSHKTPLQRRQNRHQHHQPLPQHCLNTLNVRSIHTREECNTDTRVPGQGTNPNSLPTAILRGKTQRWRIQNQDQYP